MPRKSRTPAHRADPAVAVERRLVNRPEAARILGVTAATLAAWSLNGTLRPVTLPSTAARRPHVKPFRRVLYSVADLDALVAKGRAVP